ncbi:retinol-binding protein 4-like [Pecten maximus]|uniref:retinol-binding protein 4-like n=1 Tax=Pecten maximus TaxID=6579 RepID=UPI0014591489|nr:retinol-binding protein 4-like [Pecten maximus]
MDLKSQILIVLCLSLTMYWCNGQGYQDCNIDRFRVQQNLNMSRFGGQWYGISANREFNPVTVATRNNGGMGQGVNGGGWGMFSGFNAGMPRQTPWANTRPIRNLQYYFEILSGKNGTMRTYSSGAVMGRRCYYAQGINKPTNLSIPAKTDFLFQGSSFPIWIISTDYEGYAVIYSCWNTDVNGECTPDSSYVISLNRVMEGHTAEELKQVEAASSYVCVQPNLLRPVIHDGGCAFNATDFPSQEFAIMNDINNNYFSML